MIHTTHTGSLARPPALEEALGRVAKGGPDDGLGELVRGAVADIVARQVEVGLDIVNDGELGKTGFFGYVAQRLSGYERFELPSDVGGMPEGVDFPEWAA